MSGESTMKYVGASVNTSTTVERGDLISDLIQPESATQLAEALSLLASLIAAGISLWEEQKSQPKEEQPKPEITVNVAAPQVNIEAAKAPVVNVAAPNVNVESPTVNVEAPNVNVEAQLPAKPADGPVIHTQDFSKMVWVLAAVVAIQFLLLLFLVYKIA